MSILIKGLKMPEKGEYDATLRVYADGTATIDFVSTVLGDYAFYVTNVPAPHGRPVDAMALKEIMCADCDNKHLCAETPACDTVREIDAMPTIEPELRWIPCSERLPERDKAVLITWVNHKPMSYYADIKDVPFTAVAVWHGI